MPIATALLMDVCISIASEEPWYGFGGAVVKGVAEALVVR